MGKDWGDLKHRRPTRIMVAHQMVRTILRTLRNHPNHKSRPRLRSPIESAYSGQRPTLWGELKWPVRITVKKLNTR